MEEEMSQATDSQSSVPSSECEDEVTLDDLLGSFLHSMEVCEQSSEEQEKLLDTILASQEPPEPDCLQQLQMLIERDCYRVIDLTETDSDAKQWQNNVDGIKIELEAKEEPNEIEDFGLFEMSSTSKSDLKNIKEEQRNKEKRKRKYDERFYTERKIKILPKKFHLRPRSHLYWNEENILYVKTQENIYSYWSTYKKAKTVNLDKKSK